MKLARNEYIVHALNPDVFYLSFCGSLNSITKNNYKYYEGSGDTVTCKTCKKLMQKNIL